MERPTDAGPSGPAGPADPTGPAGPAAPAGSAGSAGSARPAALEAVLRQALILAESDAGLAPDQRRRAGEVARRHAHLAFCLDPVAIDLVEAVLHPLLGIAPAAAASWRPVCAAVAASLVDHPGTHDRLRDLWQRLRSAGDHRPSPSGDSADREGGAA